MPPLQASVTLDDLKLRKVSEQLRARPETVLYPPHGETTVASNHAATAALRYIRHHATSAQPGALPLLPAARRDGGSHDAAMAAADRSLQEQWPLSAKEASAAVVTAIARGRKRKWYSLQGWSRSNGGRSPSRVRFALSACEGCVNPILKNDLTDPVMVARCAYPV